MGPINFHTDTRHHEWLYNSVKSDGVEIKKLRRFLWNNREEQRERAANYGKRLEEEFASYGL
jgi:hypothetical protein